jgi:AraC-like DNA-binding protein
MRDDGREDALIQGKFTWKPALCIVALGAKAAAFGHRTVHDRAGQALLVSVEMPGRGWVVEASPKAPFLGIALKLDLAVLRDVYEQLDDPPELGKISGQGVLVTDFDGPLTDCVLRMMRLLSTPRAIGVLYPAIMREICYWLLAGPHGGEVAQMTLSSAHARPIVRAIHELRDRFARRVRMEELASIACLSPSAFHRQFKELTSMTPLQYRKQLPLLEARRHGRRSSERCDGGVPRRVRECVAVLRRGDRRHRARRRLHPRAAAGARRARPASIGTAPRCAATTTTGSCPCRHRWVERCSE